MRIRVPGGLTKYQFYVVCIIGLGTGFYNWNSLIKSYIKESEDELQLNEN